MLACTFFGHRDCFGLSREKLYSAIEALIGQGIEEFYVGNQGQFDSMVYHCLKQLSSVYPHIRIAVVLAYLPTEKREYEDHTHTVYPEGMENVPRKFAIDRRNEWMLSHTDYVICYITHSWGGAYKFCRLAKKQGKHVVNLGDPEMQ